MTSWPVTPLSATVAICLPATGSMSPSLCSPLLATSGSPPEGPSAAAVMGERPAAVRARAASRTAAWRIMAVLLLPRVGDAHGRHLLAVRPLHGHGEDAR